MANRELKVKILGDASGAQKAFGLVNDAGNKMGALMVKAGAVIGAGIGAAGIAGIKVAADFQQTTIAFNTMLGSGEKASAFLSKLRDFAATTPFEFPELATAASSLISVGVDANKVIPIMTSLGNATAGMGTGAEGVKRATVALQQMSAAGRITGEDLNQLRDAGIPVFDLLSAATGKSKEAVAALAQQGKLGKKEMEQLFKALETGKGLERFNGLMDAQSKTLNGVISTLKDTLSNIAIDFITPYLPGMTSALQGFSDFVQNTGVPALHALIDGIGDVADKIGGRAETIVAGFGRLADGIKADIDRGDWNGVGERIGDAIYRGLKGAGASIRKIGIAISDLFDKVDWVGVGIAIGKQAPALVLGLAAGLLNFDVGAIFRGIANHWADILLAAVGLALTPARFLGPIGKALEKLPFGKVLSTALFKAKDIADAAFKFALHAVEALGNGLLRGIGLLGPKGAESMRTVILGVIKAVSDRADDLFKTAAEFTRRLPAGMLSVLDDIGRAIGTILRFIFDAYKDASTWLFTRGVELIVGLTNGVRTEAAVLFDYFLYIPRRIFELLSSIGTWLIEHGRQLIAGLKGGMDISVVDVWRFFYETLPQRIISAVSSAGTWLVRGGAQIMEGMLSGTAGVWESAVWPWFRALGGRVSDAAGHMGSVLLEKGRDVLRSFGRGVSEGWDGAAGWLRGLYMRVVDTVGSFYYVLTEAGKDIIRSLIRGFDSMMGELGRKLNDVGDFIRIHKGPPEKDAVMLFPAGRLIMQGLMAGIDSKRGDLRSLLGEVSGDIGLGGSFGVNASAAAGGSGVVNNYNINAPGAYAEPITEAGLALLMRRTEFDYSRPYG